MKYLKHFENVDELKSIRDYIALCFVDFLDEENEYFFNVELDIDDKCSVFYLFEIFIEVPKLDFHSYNGDFDSLKSKVMNDVSKYTEIIERIEDNINKVRIKYNDFDYKVTPESEDLLHLEITRNK